tara:strand:+ start:53 stop:1330 length:1278 start_codon:yes stop_codon:yes gene_type:complete
MANNKFYGYTPDPSKEKDGNRLDRLNPYEFKKGMDYELVNVGCYRLAESTVEERETATEKVIKNLQEYGGYYSALITYETKYRNPVEGVKKPSFKSYLKEVEDNHMIEVDKTYSNDKMTEPKYKKEDYITKFETGKMGNFKLKALKEAIKREIIREAEKNEAETGGKKKGNCCYGLPSSDPNGLCCRRRKYGRIKKKSTSTKMNEAPDCGPDGCPPGHKCTWNGCKLNKPTNYRGKSKENPFDTGTGPTNPTKKLNEKELIGGKYYRKDTCRCYWSDGSSNSVWCTVNEGGPNEDNNLNEGVACEDCCMEHGMVAQNPTQHRRSPAISEAKKDKDVYDMDDELEPSKSQIKGIDKSIGDAKEALAQAIKKVKELGPDIKKLAKETNEKIKKNPAGKADYLKTYTTNPDVKAFIKLRKMLKNADLL